MRSKPSPSPRADSAESRGAAEGEAGLRVGNQAKGVEDQPDYDAEAISIREEVTGELPDPMPSAKLACAAMLDAARGAYVRSDGAGASAVEMLDQSRESDLAACVRDTKPRAAACVAILATRHGGEFPKLLDQCSRAFR